MLRGLAVPIGPQDLLVDRALLVEGAEFYVQLGPGTICGRHARAPGPRRPEHGCDHRRGCPLQAAAVG